MKAPHEFDGIQARGRWIIAEQRGEREKTAGGLVVPEVSRMLIWEVISVGPETAVVTVGERIIFSPPSPPQGGIEVDGRRFMLLLPESIVATLPKDAERPLLTLVSGHEARSVLQ